jgi:hypothetical protein
MRRSRFRTSLATASLFGLLTVLGCHLSHRTQNESGDCDKTACTGGTKSPTSATIETKPYPQAPDGAPSKPANQWRPRTASDGPPAKGQTVLLETENSGTPQKSPATLPNFIPTNPKPIQSLPVIENGAQSREPKPIQQSSMSAIHATEEMPAAARPVILGHEPTPATTESQTLSSPARPSGDFGHAQDHSWLIGKLTYIESRGAWWLRYAPADQEEQFGGAVTLVGDDFTAACKNGQVVRVEGNPVNPASLEPRPPYWVRKIEVLRPAPAGE